MPLLAKHLLVVLTLACAACGDTSNNGAPIALLIESQDNIVSETGVLALTEGVLSIRSVSLVGADGDVLLMDGDRISLGESVELEFVDGPRSRETVGKRLARRLGWAFSVFSALVICGFLLRHIA